MAEGNWVVPEENTNDSPPMPMTVHPYRPASAQALSYRWNSLFHLEEGFDPFVFVKLYLWSDIWAMVLIPRIFERVLSKHVPDDQMSTPYPQTHPSVTQWPHPLPCIDLFSIITHVTGFLAGGFCSWHFSCLSLVTKSYGKEIISPESAISKWKWGDCVAWGHPLKARQNVQRPIILHVSWRGKGEKKLKMWGWAAVPDKSLRCRLLLGEGGRKVNKELVIQTPVPQSPIFTVVSLCCPYLSVEGALSTQRKQLTRRQ